MHNGDLLGTRQLSPPRFSLTQAADYIRAIVGPSNDPNKQGPYHLVVERYQIFPWQFHSHKFKDVPTLRLIGMLQYIASIEPFVKTLTLQGPADAKKWVTDKKLKLWNLYTPGQPHAMDALRHAVYFSIFGGKRVANEKSHSTVRKTDQSTHPQNG